MRVPLAQRFAAPTIPPAVAGVVAAVLWLLALGFGAFGVFDRLVDGHRGAAYTSYLPWGLWVAAYIYFIGLSAGAFLLSTLVYVFRIERFQRVGKLSLFIAFVTLFAALLAIWFDIGRMERFWEIYAYGRPTSMMAWMVWLYTAYFALITVELWLAMRADLVRWSGEPGPRGWVARALTFGYTGLSAAALRRDADWLRLLGTLGVPLAVAFHGGVGALFGVVGARPYWNASIVPITFLGGALLSGGALLTAAVAFLWPRRGSAGHRDLVWSLGVITLGLLVLYLLLEWAEFSINLYADIPAEAQPYEEVLTGQYWWVFWMFHIVLGAVIPVALLALWPRSVLSVGTSAALIALGLFAVRLNVVIPGLVQPQFEGLEDAFVEPRLAFDYVPSAMEWLVLIFVVTLVVGLFYAGWRLLPLTGEEEATREVSS